MTRRLAVAAVLFGCTSLLCAQQVKVLAPHRPVEPELPFTGKWHSPAVPRSMVGGFWMIDANFKSTIHIRNNVKLAPLTVTPVLYLSNGRMYQLDDVKLEPAGTAVVNINQALAEKGIAPWATLMGYVEIRYAWPWDALCVTVRSVDPVHSLIFTHYLEGSGTLPRGARDVLASLQPNILEGIWWKQESGVTGFVALSNTLPQPIDAKIQVSDGAAKPIAQHSITVPPHGTKLVNLNELKTTASSEGGIRITWDGPEKGFIVNGGLKDQATGYSAHLPLHFPPVASAPTAQLSHVAVGLMSGAADPMMSFPAGTTFTPYAVVRNISDQPMSVTPTVWWMDGSAPHSARLPQFQLPAYRTQNLDLPALFAKAGLSNFNGNVNLVLDTDGRSRALLAATGSVDKNNTYVFEVHCSGIMEGVGRILSYWSTRDGDDTMVTLWNPADEAQDFVFTLFFSRGHYRLPIRLDARATRMFNVSEVIENQIPDDEGNVVPATVHEGSAELTGPEGENQHILVALDAGTYNVRKATCGQYCGTCHGVVDAWVTPGPFWVDVDGQTQLAYTIEYDSGNKYNDTSGAYWESSNTSLATVNAGLVSGAVAGPVSMTASDDNIPDYWSGCLGYLPDGWCQAYGFPVSGDGTVQKPDHLYVLSDSQNTVNCSPNPSSRIRQITYEVADGTDTRMQIPFSLRENVPTNIYSSCNGQLVQVGATCTSNISYQPGLMGEFTDYLSPGCPASAGDSPCGFQFAKQQWQWCPGVGQPTSIGTIGADNVENTIINVDGNITGFNPGTTFPK